MPSVRFNWYTFALGAVVLAMWYTGAAQENGGAYLLAFLTGSVGLVSWLHAKANLRGLALTVGSIGTASQGGVVSLPLALTAGKGQPPRGLEISAEGALEPVFVGEVTSERPASVHLRVAAGEAGLHEGRRVIVRSRYPLGFFTARRVFKLPKSYLVHPSPAGRLALPPLTENACITGDDKASSPGGSSGAGADFAGVREWQAGDSLRQVDWKAVARGRPLMVKLWTAEPKGVLWLDWSDAFVPEAARAGQFAAWMLEAEARGLPYGLRLPKAVIPPGLGQRHHRRCLDELALLQPVTHAVSKPPEKANTAETRMPFGWAELPGRPVGVLTLAMLLAGLPMIGNIPGAGIMVYYIAFLLQWRRRRLQPVSQILRLALVAAGAAGTWLQAGTMVGVEAGVSVLMAVCGGKVLEARSAHDLQVVGILGWFLCLCILALDQGLGHTLYALAVFLLVAMALIRLRRGGPGLKMPFRLALTLFAQALPLVLLLFPVFPRGFNDMGMGWVRRLAHRTGMSSDLNPGSIAEIAQSPLRAFWATFPEGRAPDASERYWRCLVLWQCDGLAWKRGIQPPAVKLHRPREAEIRQTITLDPHGGQWLPALDVPVHVMSNVREHEILPEDELLASSTPVTAVRRYDVGSIRRDVPSPVDGADDNDPLPPAISADTRRAATAVPPDLSPAVKALAATFKAAGVTDADHARAALKYFRDNGFRYTLQPETYPDHPLDTFLFRRRLGFCEHFAASFATLMRACGIPARVVVGYVGGEYSEHWNHYIVRQSDAHAWCELWYEGRGWTRVDPTAALAPGRLGTDLQSYLASGQENDPSSRRATWWGQALNEGLLFWDNINYQWYSSVVQFDEADQLSLFNSLHLSRMRFSVLVVTLCVVFGLPLLFLWLWLRRTPRHPDPAVRAWQRFCRKLARAGVPRLAHEPPATFTARAAQALPAAAPCILHIGGLYVRHRYAGDDSVSQELKRSIRAFHAPRKARG